MRTLAGDSVCQNQWSNTNKKHLENRVSLQNTSQTTAEETHGEADRSWKNSNLSPQRGTMNQNMATTQLLRSFNF